jgi:hypothetical protein
MDYQPSRAKSPKGAIHQYKKPFREKRKDKKRIRRRFDKSTQEEKPTATEREISERTLKQLHTLGSQKFGSSPFGEHFDRWLTNLAIVLGEFESHPNIIVDDQFVKERAETFAGIEHQLKERREKETSLNQEITNLSYYKSSLKQIDTEYVTMIAELKKRKTRETKPLHISIDQLKKEQDKVIRMKTGFFRGFSRKEREQKEIKIDQELNDKQRELELIVMDFNAKQKDLREDYERKREPVLEQRKKFQKIFQNLETDGSLEERWFACEALIDTVITFLQRKAMQSHDPKD